MKRNVIETIMGGVVLILAIAFLAFAYTRSGLTRVSGYEVTARFNRVDGLVVGSDVRMSGIKVGAVTALALDTETFQANMRISLQSDLRLPSDSSARIASDGLLGSNYVLLEPGGEEALIEPGGEITYTQDPVNIVDLVSRFIFSSGEEEKGENGAAAEEAPASP
jgi:phospholipid/cholesterol/gamma-HCH transport system substrate-binding protein